MSQGPTGYRPGGLTALAVLNFIFGGLGVIVLLIAFLGLSVLQAAANHAGVTGTAPVLTFIYIALLLSTIQVILLITSGVGYLGQKRFTGKTLGSVYGILGIVGSIVGYLGFRQFDISSIIGLIYPVLTLILLNTVFKDDFPNP